MPWSDNGDWIAPSEVARVCMRGAGHLEAEADRLANDSDMQNSNISAPRRKLAIARTKLEEARLYLREAAEELEREHL